MSGSDPPGGGDEIDPANADDEFESANAEEGFETPTADESFDPKAAFPDATEYEPTALFPDATEMDLRPGADGCYKCSTCDTTCPVAEVDDEFPGPKFQGPEQWRLTRKDDHDVDPSIEKCSNCLRCDHACPTDVPFSRMHNAARAAYVDRQQGRLSRTYWRNRLLSNYELLARIASTVPWLANAIANRSIVRRFNEAVLGITSEREVPTFASETFREWWRARGGAAASAERARAAREASGSVTHEASTRETGEAPNGGDGDPPPSADRKRVAYFHGCYTNYNTPEVGRATVRVFEGFGYEVIVPPQRCSGTPMFANGMLDDARRAATTNVDELVAAIEDGADVVASCTSCSLSLRREYPDLFDLEGIETVATNTYDALEYLRIHEDLEGALQETSVDLPNLAYHAPCHARNQGLDGQAREVLAAIDGVEVHDVGDSCSGISGTYGWKDEHYETSMAIGEEMFQHMERTDAETGLTECPTCAMQMEHGSGYEIRHPMEILEAALAVTGE